MLEQYLNILYSYRVKRARVKNNINIKWTPNFAYALGLLATDGSLSIDGRHFDLISKDREQLVNFMHCLNIKVKIGKKISTYTKKTITRIQFGNVKLYKFLLGIGFSHAKTKIIGVIDISKKYLFDFLRGHHDGDGCFYSYWDPRWKHSFMFYLVFISASEKHVQWIQDSLYNQLKIKGYITHAKSGGVYLLRFAKSDSFKLLKRMYYNDDVICLSRKRLKIEKALRVMGKTL